MSVFNILSAALIILIIAAATVLFTGLRAASMTTGAAPDPATAPDASIVLVRFGSP